MTISEREPRILLAFVLLDFSSGHVMLCNFSARSPQVSAALFHRYPQRMTIGSYDTLSIQRIILFKFSIDVKILHKGSLLMKNIWTNIFIGILIGTTLLLTLCFVSVSLFWNQS